VSVAGEHSLQDLRHLLGFQGFAAYVSLNVNLMHDMTSRLKSGGMAHKRNEHITVNSNRTLVIDVGCIRQT
jgi:hypothetical protein